MIDRPRVDAPQPRSIAIIWLCFVVAILEGFDLQVAGIAAPALAPEMRMGPDLLGWFFSASTIGLLIGALIGGRLSDRIGRGMVLTGSVTAFGLASIATGLAPDVWTLIGARGLTGLGLGGALPNLLALTAENALPGKERRAVGLLYCGVPIGGAAVSIVGTAAAPDWRLPFIIGGVLPLIVALALYRVAKADIGRPQQRQRPAGVVHALFAGQRATLSILLWLSFFATLIILYLVLNWLPTLLVGLGISPRAAFLAQLAFNAGGIGLCAITAPLLDGKRAWIVALGAFASIPVFLQATTQVEGAGMAIAAAFFLGGAVLVTQSYLYALAPTLYPAEVRATGVGAAVAAGRLGSIAGPLFGAAILATGGDTAAVLRGLVPISFIAGAAAIVLTFKARSRTLP